jgi:hypothetical protein
VLDPLQRFTVGAVSSVQATVRNPSGPGTGTGLRLTFQANGLITVFNDGGWSCPGPRTGSLTCSRASLPRGAATTVGVFGPASGTVRVTVGSDNDPNPGNNSRAA